MKNAVDKYEQETVKLEEEKSKLFEKINNAQAGKEETVGIINETIFLNLFMNKTFDLFYNQNYFC